MLLVGGIVIGLHQRGIAMEQGAVITDLITAAIEVIKIHAKHQQLSRASSLNTRTVPLTGSWAGWAVHNSWRTESMHSVHRHKTRGSDFFWCAAASFPQAADWPQRPLTQMAALILSPLQAPETLQPKARRRRLWRRGASRG